MKKGFWDWKSGTRMEQIGDMNYLINFPITGIFWNSVFSTNKINQIKTANNKLPINKLNHAGEKK